MGTRARHRLLWGGGMGFLLLSVAAALAYPGGHGFDPAAEGYDFWRNFVCDPLRSPALNGESNRLGAALAALAMGSLLVALGPFWWSLSELAFAEARPRRWVRALGGSSVFAGAAIPLTNLVGLHSAHPVAVAIAGLSALFAATSSLFGLLSRRAVVDRALVWLGGPAVASTWMNLGLYEWVAWHQLPMDPNHWLTAILPGFQKISTGIGLLWMGAVGLSAERRARS